MAVRSLLMILSMIAIAACGEPDDPEPRNIIAGNSTMNSVTNNMSTNNTVPNSTALNTGFGPECAGVECDGGGMRCVRGACVDETLLVACEVPEELGEVDLATMYMGSGDTAGFVDGIKAHCGSENPLSGAENAISFTVPALAVASFKLTSSAPFDWLIEVREEACIDLDTNAVECSDVEDFDFPVEPGQDYWILVEPSIGIDVGAFDWTLSFQGLICVPGERTCEDATTVLECRGGDEEVLLGCGTACDAGVCHGDSCADPVEVTAGMSFSGDSRGFTSSLDFGSQTTCSTGAEGIQTPGQEMVLSLPNLTSGQTVTVDASMNDTNDNAIFVLETCAQDTPCLAANDIGDVLTWTVPADGAYFIVIDKLSSSPREFNYTIDIQ